MRGRRAKTYKKLMEKFSITFGFREPYQVLVDAEMVCDTNRFHMELTPALERTLRGKVKPLITQCSIRHLYARKDEPGMDKLIEFAKTLERRRCGHHPDDHPEPLSTLECLSSIVDPKSRGENKHRYIVASQEQDVRRYMRHIPGVPLVYVNRSVMIMEPMTDVTEIFRDREERAKMRAEFKKPAGALKRKRQDAEGDNIVGDVAEEDGKQPEKKRKKKYGKKEPNPLSVKKPKKKPQPTGNDAKKPRLDDLIEPPKKNIKKRRGKKKKSEGLSDNGQPQAAAESAEASS